MKTVSIRIEITAEIPEGIDERELDGIVDDLTEDIDNYRVGGVRPYSVLKRVTGSDWAYIKGGTK